MSGEFDGQGLLTSRHKPTPCPKCLAPLDAAAHMTTDQKPEPGDWSVCAYCFAPLVYQGDLKLKAMTRKEFRAAQPKDRQNLALAVEVARRTAEALGRMA